MAAVGGSEPSDPALAPQRLARLADELVLLRQNLLAGEARLEDVLASVHSENRASARNLAHYLALRRNDIRALQLALARAGLSSLGRSEPHVLVTINRVLSMLALARGTAQETSPVAPVGFREGERILARNTRRLFGAPHAARRARIIVTLPSEAADDPQIVHDLMAAGMDCARINCAHDDSTAWRAMATHVAAAAHALGRRCRILVDLAGAKLRTGPVAGGASRLILAKGDSFDLVLENGAVTVRDGARPRIGCPASEVFQAQPGQPIWFDDGKIGGVIEEKSADMLRVRVTHASPDGSKLRAERGINLPETELLLPALTEKDRQDLAAVVPFANAINLSFVQRPEDVRELLDALRANHAEHVAIVLKIETRRGFDALPQIILAAMQHRDCGVMIARGDLAVESGFERLAEVQEEILWIAEAAHVPTVWATQVLENLAKNGTLSRAEMSDAAMGGRAEAVMLNKGPFIIDAIRTLDDVLTRMQSHQSKKRPIFRPLRVGSDLWR